MNRFCLNYLFVSALMVLCGFFYPIDAYGQNGNLYPAEQPASGLNNTGALYSKTKKQETDKPQSNAIFQTQEVQKKDGTLLRGLGGDGGGSMTSPIGHGFLILMGLGIFYVVSLALFRLKAKGKLSKAGSAFFLP